MHWGMAQYCQACIFFLNHLLYKKKSIIVFITVASKYNIVITYLKLTHACLAWNKI